MSTLRDVGRSLLVYSWAAIVLLGARPYLYACRKKIEQGDKVAEERLHRLVQRFAHSIIRLTGSSIRIEGAEKIPDAGPVLFVGNHRGLFDIPLLLTAAPHLTGFLAKHELKKVQVLDPWIQGIGSVYIDRGGGRKALEAIARAAKQLQASEGYMAVFPEGTRSQDGKVGTFKPGAFKIATRSRATIVPFAITGTEGILPRGTKLLHRSDVTLTFFDPIEAKETSFDTTDLAETLQKMITNQVESEV